MNPKYKERKFLFGAISFILLIVLSLISANSTFVFPEVLQYLLWGIAVTWLVTEGLLDWKKISKSKNTSPETE